jgi:4-hydroxy-tetrahydrodipicolinate synthase
VIASARLRAPGYRLSEADVADVERLLVRQERRLDELAQLQAGLRSSS